MVKLDIKNIDDVFVCLQCGYCKAYCPTAQQIGWESSSPRGKIYWLKKIQKSSWWDRLLGRHYVPDDEWMKKLFSCTLCGRCESVCHTDIPFHEFWEDTRRYMVEHGLTPPGGSVDMYNSIFNEKFFNPFMEPLEKRDEWYKDSYQLPKTADVVFYIGCMTSYYEYKLLQNIMKVFTKAGLNFTTLGCDERCCGAINLMTGQFSRFEELAVHNVKEIHKRKASRVVTNCPGCYRMLKRYDGHVDKFDLEVLHTTEILAELVHADKLEMTKEYKAKNAPLIYHDPCELGRIGEFEDHPIYEEPRFVLENVPGISEVLEFPMNKRNSSCCGGGGGLKAVNYDLTTKIVLTRIDEAIDSGANSIASSCPNCLNQITIGTKLKKEILANDGGSGKFKMPVLDVFDVVAKTLK